MKFGIDRKCWQVLGFLIVFQCVDVLVEGCNCFKVFKNGSGDRVFDCDDVFILIQDIKFWLVIKGVEQLEGGQVIYCLIVYLKIIVYIFYIVLGIVKVVVMKGVVDMQG